MKASGLFSLLAVFALFAAPPAYRVSGKIPIGGEGGWDYLIVDAPASRIYVSHATKVVVVDVKTEKVVGEIPDTAGVHGIALAPKLNRGYTSNGRTNNVSVFDLKTLRVLKQVATGQNPDAILYEAKSNRVMVFNGRSKDATVIDAATDAVVGTIPLGGKPEFSVADGDGRVYVNIEDTHEMAEIDAAKATVTKRYSLTGCEDPTGLAMDVKKRRLFSVCGNKVMVVSNPDTAKVIATVPIGDGSDGAGFDAADGVAFSSNGEGSLTIVGERDGKYVVLQTLATAKGARTMTVDAATHKIYAPAADYGPTPAPTKEKADPRPTVLPNTMRLLVIDATLLRGADKKLKIESLPPAVQQTVKAETQDATLVGLAKEKEKGKVVYELETKKANGQTRDLMIDAAGAILSVEDEIGLDALPAGAKAAIEKLAAGAKILRVESLTEGKVLTSYEAEIERKGRKTTVSVKPDGSPMK